MPTGTVRLRLRLIAKTDRAVLVAREGEKHGRSEWFPLHKIADDQARVIRGLPEKNMGTMDLSVDHALAMSKGLVPQPTKGERDMFEESP